MDAVKLSERFAPFEALAADLLPHAVNPMHDPAHDVGHLYRVFSLAMRIAAVEGGEREILAAAVLLHDCVAVVKGASRRRLASRLAARKAQRLLRQRGWREDRVAQVEHAIEAHSYSARIEPRTLEACIVQDADRLDALGAVGIARCLMLGGHLGRPLHDPLDPAAERRPLDDTAWTLDHFATKLLRLRGTFRTREGARLAEERHARVVRFRAELLDEIGVEARLA